MCKYFAVFIVSVSFMLQANACELTMGYRTNERPPLINSAPNNAGLYYSLYSSAANKIGCKLKILRKPKKRILSMIRQGIIDFYPGLNYTDTRAEYIYYIENGLQGGDVAISRPELPNITDLTQLKGKVALVAFGSPEWGLEEKGVLVRSPTEMSLSKAVSYILQGKADFYIYNKDSIAYYQKLHPEKTIKIHPQCCGGLKPMYLGFSRNSIFYQAQLNPSYKSELLLSPNNDTMILQKESIASRFAAALKEMKDSGEIDKLYKQYYH